MPVHECVHQFYGINKNKLASNNKYTHSTTNKERGYTSCFQLILTHNKRKQLVMYSGTIWYAEVWHGYFLATNPPSNTLSFSHITRMFVHHNKIRHKHLHILCDSDIKNRSFQKKFERFEHQMFCWRDTCFLLANRVRCFFPIALGYRVHM